MRLHNIIICKVTWISSFFLLFCHLILCPPFHLLSDLPNLLWFRFRFTLTRLESLDKNPRFTFLESLYVPSFQGSFSVPSVLLHSFIYLFICLYFPHTFSSRYMLLFSTFSDKCSYNLFWLLSLWFFFNSYFLWMWVYGSVCISSDGLSKGFTVFLYQDLAILKKYQSDVI